ncbi:Uncharacterized protein BP5553_08187 [Venustampulla echinocandica]|uniref:ER transporter 6TM N-terminal domain-containing protein n=1 Tax=Venustampulla echinocandica TaxID=2656787 RepID=A0A370TG01_9HELO|nr:Uncharacterized protein BP5553_08187 [Venustampulla echinocandica]RDL33819.1 Uncharacterized protein BP5553_08187 [Venustampulla echinocandica]
MEKIQSSSKRLHKWTEKRTKEIWDNLGKNHLWQRMLKNTLATTIAVILALIPAVVGVYGKAAYLAPITTVFGHPGRRFGTMAEALVLVLAGALIGIGWSMLGIYLSSLVYEENAPAAYTIRGIFLAIALLLHGFLRSHTPRLFLFVLLLVIVCVVSLTSTAVAVTASLATQILYPILTAAGILIIINLLVLPEFSSSFLGTTTIEALGETVDTLRDAGKYFVSIVEEPQKGNKEPALEPGRESQDTSATSIAQGGQKAEADSKPSLLHKAIHLFLKRKKPTQPTDTAPKIVRLETLTGRKAKLRAQLGICKAAQMECNFELAWGVLPPRDMKPISQTAMKKLVENTISLIGACESKYALLGDPNEETASEKNSPKLGADEAGVDTGSGEETSRPGTAVSQSDDGSGDYKTTNGKTKDKKRTKRRKKTTSKSKNQLGKEREDLELVKPTKEIESGDVELLKYLVTPIAKPLADLQEKIDRSVDVVTSCLAHCYGVRKLPSGARPPAGIQLQEIDVWIDVLLGALTEFDKNSAVALEGAAAVHDLDQPTVDVMPRMEIFLISSFILNLRQAALHTLDMLRHSRVIVEKWQARHGRSRFYPPKIKWRKWLFSGGEVELGAFSEGVRPDARTGKKRNVSNQDDSPTPINESPSNKKDAKLHPTMTTHSQRHRGAMKSNWEPKPKVEDPPRKDPLTLRLRKKLADLIEYTVDSDDVLYAIKFTAAVFLVTWPAFLSQWNTWYSLNRGLWAALQLVLVTEVAIGTSLVTFSLRAVGTTVGCVWGFIAYQTHNGNRVVCVVMLVIGIVPSTYIQLGSKYFKAGMVSVVSMCVVALATEDITVPGTATDNFLKRMIAFLIGGTMALVIQFAIFPVRARDKMIESLTSSISKIMEMEACLAYGIELDMNLDARSDSIAERFRRAKGKAQGALTAVEIFLPFCVNEPRLKGSFAGIEPIYAEMLYVLRAIVDRMDNMMSLRHEYGSGVLEELNPKVHAYRRNVAGSITVILFSVREALTTKLPLPQFLPSARLAHLRMINRVREVVLDRRTFEFPQGHSGPHSEIESMMLKNVLRQNFLSWNAFSAGQIEVIEFLEELIELAKLLVGANEFRSGMLTRPTYRDYTDHIDGNTLEPTRDLERRESDLQHDDERDELREMIFGESLKMKTHTRRRRALSESKSAVDEKKSRGEDEQSKDHKQPEEDVLPMSLQRVRSRRLSLARSRSNNLEGTRRGT